MALDLHKKALSSTKYKVKPLEITEDIVNSKYYKDPLQLLGEKNFGRPRKIPKDEIGTPIQEFFRDASVFVTGGTGFMGKILVEKLLRAIPHLKHIYLLVRPKKGKAVQERLEAIFEDRLFLRLKTEVPHFLEKISAVAGDVSLPGLGLSETDRELLRTNVNVIFHGAATVRFDEKIQLAVAINVLGVRAMLELAREIRQLKSFVHVSTAFAHYIRSNLGWKIQERKPISGGWWFESKSSHENLNSTTTWLPLHSGGYRFESWLENPGKKTQPYTYPEFVSTYREPVRGWIDNVYGPVGLMVGIGTGVLHTYQYDQDAVTEMVPVDMVVNSVIATAWYTAKSNQQQIPIYNYVSSVQKPVTWNEFLQHNIKHGHHWPTIRAVWYYSFWPTKSRIMFLFLNFLLHTIPGLILDGVASMFGKTPMLSSVYTKLGKVASTLEYFVDRKWNWSNENVQALWDQLSPEDQEMFFFDMG
ncbi:fatty acyl-CoA reductase wat-like, partial [Diaphorina citri]|uniref:Fatty acyl-CoA reductase n=1 Tax=Diaphorina citri TaxID=121845 RepID=A0A3Q0IVZ0_DIACI